MKIAIVTIYDFFNHGNRLQNYALEQTMKSLGHDVYTLAVTPKNFYKYVMPLANIVPFVPVVKRMKNSRKNTKQMMNVKIIDFYSHKKMMKIGEEYDAFVIGSDQVWNPRYIANKEISFLKFANEKKCLAYAPSFGIESVPKKLEKDFCEGLSHIRYLSVRENEGAKIIKDLTGKNAPVLVDPTMLVSKESWIENFSEKVDSKPEKYILTYFLCPKKEYKEKVATIAKENNLKVVNVNKSFDKFFKVNPREFIDLMVNAELVCTNSFHGHALSIILERPFVSFTSFKNTKSRINTLLKTMKLENRNYKILSSEDFFVADFSYSRDRIAEEKKKSLEFLTNALKDIETNVGEKK